MEGSLDDLASHIRSIRLTEHIRLVRGALRWANGEYAEQLEQDLRNLREQLPRREPNGDGYGPND